MPAPVSGSVSGPRRVMTGRSARRAAALFNIGNILSVLVILPGMPLWVAASMVVYAMNRHHPNPKVGHYTQQAAYRFYGIAGIVVAVGAFFPGEGLAPWMWSWALAAAVLIPWSILDLVRIYRDDWVDVVVGEDAQ